MTKRIAIKIGSNVLTRSDGTLDITTMSSLVDQITVLHQKGIEIILISSGAVASGRSVLQNIPKMDAISERQLFSAIGQVKLINRYYDFFNSHHVFCAQVLTTKNDFSTRVHYLNQRNCIEVMLMNKVIPIVNENDTISVNELMFTDNDELSGLVATMMDCQKLIILSNIDGVYTGDPQDPKSELIASIDTTKDDIEQYICTSKSVSGRGGMHTKYNIAKRVAEEGIEVIIANGKKHQILIDILSSSKTKCTRFVPSGKTISGIKKWLAHSDGFSKGEIHINEGLESILFSDTATSILPVGVTKIEGSFEEGDIVKIINSQGKQIGLGKININGVSAQKIIGKTQQKPIIHYDYLYIDK